jgi:hypothetical protein
MLQEFIQTKTFVVIFFCSLMLAGLVVAVPLLPAPWGSAPQQSQPQ